MDIVQLKTLIRVAELGSLNKAADQLRVAQPALSRQIRLLEEELGAPLFVRHGRGMVITPIGTRVLQRANVILNEIDAIFKEVSSYRDQLDGKVVVGMPPTIGEMIAIPLTRALQEVQPLMTFRYTAGFGGHLLDWMQRGDLDLAILYDHRPMKSVQRRNILTEQLFLVGAAEKKYSIAQPLTLAELSKEPLVLPGPRHSMRALIDNFGIPLNVKFEVEALVTIKDLVISGLCSSFLPMSYIAKDLNAGLLTAAPIYEPMLERTLFVASTNRIKSRETQICEEVLIQLVSKMVSAGEWPCARLAWE